MAVKFTNNASATISIAIGPTATSIYLISGQGAVFPALSGSDFFYATLVDTSNSLEIVKVTGRSGDALTVVRGQNGTTARSYGPGDKIELRVVASQFDEFIQRDGSVPMTGSLNLGSNKINNVVDPASAQDAATKNYVDTTAVAAINTEAANRIAADALKVNKAGDTMTGTLSGTTFKSDRTSENARNTGFQISTGADIGECDRSTQYYDDRATNCNGYLPNGNCKGDPYWNPPDGNWWTWNGVSGINNGNCGNQWGYDFAGGQSNSLFPVSVSFNYDGYYEAANEIGGSEQRRWYRNCNCGNCVNNCYTNCNCNCNCNCK